MSLHYTHRSTDPVNDGRDVLIASHCDPHIAYITGFHDDVDTTTYVHRDDVPSMIVALVANTGYLEAENLSETDQRLQELAAQFIDVFREAMVPSFREDMRRAIEEADSDWDAKCRVSQIIRRYEDLR